MDKTVKFWNRIADYYSKRPVSDEASYQKKLQLTRDYFRPDMEVLEFGCGTGSTAISHSPYVKHILATDVSSRMIEICREKAGAANINNITFQCTGFDEFSADDDSFNAILALNILHLMENWEEVIIKVQRMLKPGGIFVMSTPCIGNTIFRFFKYVAYIGHFFEVLPRITAITRTQLEKSITDGDFVIEHQWQPGKNAAVFIVARKTG